MSLNISDTVRVISGKNAVIDNAGLLKEFGKKCLIVTGKGSAVKSGALDNIKTALESEKIDYSLFDEITENPKTSDCFAAGNRARESGADFIVGIGGGSPLDAAKAVAVYASNPQISSPDLIYCVPIENEPLPVVLIGTTAGTGSEVTCVSVLTNGKGKKKSVKGKNYYASLVFADSKYTYSLPYSVTVSTALDALCHASESYLSNKATTDSGQFSEKAITVLWGELVSLLETGKTPDEENRDLLYDASLYAGAAINITGCCFPHTVGYYLTEKHGVSHGRACAVFLAEYVKRGLEFKNEKALRLLGIMGTDFERFEKTVLALADVKININEEELEEYLPNWENAANFDNSPGGFTKEDAKTLFEKLFL